MLWKRRTFSGPVSHATSNSWNYYPCQHTIGSELLHDSFRKASYLLMYPLLESIPSKILRSRINKFIKTSAIHKKINHNTMHWNEREDGFLAAIVPMFA